MADAIRTCCGTSTLDECRCPPAPVSQGITPGIWRAEKWTDVEGQVVALHQGKRSLICAGVMNDDARLIAASPTLLEAAIAVSSAAVKRAAWGHDNVPAMREEQRALADLRAAITLATGEA